MEYYLPAWASRAVHLEVASSLETDACINAIRRFISGRGQVTHIRSDNGTDFIGEAKRELRQVIGELNHERIQGALSTAGVEWRLNPPAGSHHGEVRERMIRIVKNVLNSVLYQQTPDDDGLHTVMCEGKPALPPGLFKPSDMYVKRRWRQAQYISDLCWEAMDSRIFALIARKTEVESRETKYGCWRCCRHYGSFISSRFLVSWTSAGDLS